VTLLNRMGPVFDFNDIDHIDHRNSEAETNDETDDSGYWSSDAEHVSRHNITCAIRGRDEFIPDDIGGLETDGWLHEVLGDGGSSKDEQANHSYMRR